MSYDEQRISDQIEGGLAVLKTNVKAPDFLSVLEENYQAQIAGYYNLDKTEEELKIRSAIIQEYRDLIVIYKNLAKNKGF